MTVAATVEIGCDARFCWSLLADPRLAPEWVAGVADAEVVELDAGGRPRRVWFTGMPSTGSITYELAYEYDEAAMRMRWTTLTGAERQIAGEAWIEALGDGRCRVHYALAVTTSGALPRWARDTLADDTPQRVVRAFERFATRRAAASRARP